jgi:hypothetical protein
MAQEKAQAFQGKKINGQLEFTRDKTAYVNYYYFYIDDVDFGPVFEGGQLCAVRNQALPKRTRVGQETVGEKRDRL